MPTYDPSDLEEYDKGFADAPEDDGPRSGPIPPGTYQAQIMKAEIRDSYFQDENNRKIPELVLHLKLLNGAGQGRWVFPSAQFDAKPNPMLSDRAPIEFLKSMVAKLGLDPPITKASEIPLRLNDMLDRVIEVKVKANPNKPEYPKVYVQRFVTRLEPGQVVDVGKDEIPF